MGNLLRFAAIVSFVCNVPQATATTFDVKFSGFVFDESYDEDGNQVLNETDIFVDLTGTIDADPETNMVTSSSLVIVPDQPDVFRVIKAYYLKNFL